MNLINSFKESCSDPIEKGCYSDVLKRKIPNGSWKNFTKAKQGDTSEVIPPPKKYSELGITGPPSSKTLTLSPEGVSSARNVQGDSKG